MTYTIEIVKPGVEEMLENLMREMVLQGDIKLTKKMTVVELEAYYADSYKQALANGVPPITEEEIKELVDEVRQERYEKGLHNPANYKA